jgi:hypothetical protein
VCSQSGSSLLLDVWNKHKIFNSEGQEPHVALAKNKSYIVNILKQKENIVVYDSTLESTSLQTCMCRAIIQRFLPRTTIHVPHLFLPRTIPYTLWVLTKY